MSVTDHASEMPENQTIWHYRQFAEFVTILQEKALWFSRLDRLRDPLEGRSGRKSRFHQGCDAHTRKGCVSCWTIDDEESELMWFAYAPDYGVAIRSTKGRVAASFLPPDAGKIMIESVEYGIDWSNGLPHVLTINHGYAFHKRRAFKWEHELRVFLPYEYDYDGDGHVVEPTYAGKSVLVELKTLMAEVWVAPYAPDWFRAAVKKELETHGYGDVPVKRRAQDDLPESLPLMTDRPPHP